MSDLSLFDAPAAIATVPDAERALKTIAVAEAAETLWAQAKNREELYKAVKAKLTHQAAYAMWRPTASPQGRPANPSERKALLPCADPGEQTVRRWRKRLVGDGKMAAALVDAQARCVRICEQENLGTIRGTEGTGEFERYTPARYIEAAREVMGGIDLDPASSEYAQRTVQATQFYTVADNGLDLAWHGRVWLNPPYHRELAPLFISKLLNELAQSGGCVEEAIVLTNNSTDTEWFRAAADDCDAICFTAGRIRFEVPDAEPVLPTQGQAFFYFGAKTGRFIEVFNAVGWCVEPV
ncbi:MAG TPA: DNA N-6-adenine-methyltransferase [Acetobacteraceae bacterium]|jgi:hypothetical protein